MNIRHLIISLEISIMLSTKTSTEPVNNKLYMLKESQTFSYAIAGGGTLKLEIANYYETCYNFQMNAN